MSSNSDSSESSLHSSSIAESDSYSSSIAESDSYSSSEQSASLSSDSEFSWAQQGSAVDPDGVSESEALGMRAQKIPASDLSNY
jgi:hypothetical protein